VVKVYHLKINQDGTLTVRVGRHVESYELLGKNKAEIFDLVKWSLISKDVFVSDERLTSDLYGLIWSKLK
jgi:hypothetical protein